MTTAKKILLSTCLLTLLIPATAEARGRDRDRDSYDRTCREYTRTVETKYGARSVEGLACETRRGAWEIVDEPNTANEGRVFILDGRGPNNVVYIDRNNGSRIGPTDYIDFDDSPYSRYPQYGDDRYDHRDFHRHDNDRGWRYGRNDGFYYRQYND